ncbi:ABC transporter substrate-binding protein [Lachnospiraceae bacterium 42-17]|nr:ABC transporter substrate-binding protein [Dorea sp.]
MKRRVLSLLLVMMMTFSLAACGSSPADGAGKDEGAETKEEQKPEEEVTTGAEKPEVSEIHWARANSGNILVTIAREKGYLDEAGLTVIEDPMASSSDALTALETGAVDVTSNQGTNNPLQFISTGSDFTIVGGYMLKGMYLVAEKGTGFNGVEDFVGKKIAYAGVHPVVGMAMLDADIDPTDEKNVEWLTYSTNSDRLAAVAAGEADYAVLSGDQLFAVGNNPDLEITCWLDDLVPNYGCCRMNMKTEFVEKNPVTVKLLLKCLIRAEQYYRANTEECVSILAKDIDADEDYVAAYLLNENYISSVDPCKQAVVKTWDGMIKMGFIDEADIENINIEDHINVDLYKKALDECVTEYRDEDPEFYDGRVEFFEANNQ